MQVEKCFEARLSRERTERRRSVLHQKPRRETERSARLAAVEFSESLLGDGVTRKSAATMLAISERTLIEWECRSRLDELGASPRGRPLRRSSTEKRNALVVTIRDLGPHTGVEPLRSLSPTMPRSEIEDMLWRYRAVDRRRRSLG